MTDLSDREWLIDRVESLTDTKQTMSVTEFAEKNRILPKGSPFPGPYIASRNPYLIQFQDSFSDDSPVEFEVVLKSHQLGMTLAIENAILYMIKCAPAPILYTTASDSLGKEWSESRFDPMIEQTGMSKMIFSQTKKKGSRKTGDKTLLKEFPGGRIKITGYGSSAALRSSSYKAFFADELDEAPSDLRKQGDAIDIAKGRTSAYKSKRKIALFSTPVEKDASKVYAAYILGDQRKYFVPCPFCGFMQQLLFKHLVYTVDKDGVLDHESVKHECQNEDCDKFIFNYHKAELYAGGKCEWRPTAKAKRKNYISRQMSCLYSPPGMITFSDIVQEYLTAEQSADPAKMKAFVTLYLGLPYEEKGEKPEYGVVISHRAGYASKTVPDDVLFLTLGGDIQGDRIELEVLGHGRKFKTWSIDYVVIKGNTESITAGAWPLFREKFLNGEFLYKNSRGSFAPQMGFIDSHYREPTVISFCETVTGLFPIIGKNKFSNTQQKFKINSLPGSNLMSVVLGVDHLKDIVYNGLRIDKGLDDETPIGYPAFPYDYPDSYFKMLNAEYKRKVKIGSRVETEYYCPGGRRNEALDCRVYNLGAREVLYHHVMKDMLDKKVEEFEQAYRRKATPAERTEFFYQYMESVGCFQ